MNQKQQPNFTIPVNQHIDDLSYIVKIYKEHFGIIPGGDQVALKYMIKEFDVKLLAQSIVETADNIHVRNAINAIDMKIRKWHRLEVTTVEGLEQLRRKQIQA